MRYISEALWSFLYYLHDHCSIFVEQLLTYIFFNSICRVSSRDDHEGLQELGKIVN